MNSAGLRAVIAAGTVATVVLVLAVAAPVAGATGVPGWSEPTRVSTAIPGQVDWFPTVAADNFGNVHVVWNSTAYDDGTGKFAAKDPANTLGQLAYTRWNGSSWTPQTDLAMVWYGFALRTSLATDASGRVDLVYKGWGTDELQPQAGSTQDLFFMTAPGSDASTVRAWTTSPRLSNGGVAYYSDVAVDSQGVIHAIWTENDALNYGLFYARSTNGGATWSDPLLLSGDEAVWWYRAHLLVDQQDRLHVVYEVTGSASDNNAASDFGVTNKAVYQQSIDGGHTWTRHDFTPLVTSQVNQTGIPGPQQPVVGVDGNGTILLVYREYGTDRILYRESADGSRWTDPQPLPGIKSGVARPYDVYSTAIDSASHVHLVMVGYPQGSSQMAVLHSVWNGQSWSQPDVIATPPPFPEYPRIAIGQGNQLNVVWFGGDTAAVNRTPSGIWFSTATVDDAPRISGQALSLPAPSISQEDKITPTAQPTLSPKSSAIPTPDALTAAEQTTYTASSTGTAGILREPALPVAAAVVLAGGLVIAILCAQIRNRFNV